MKKYLQIFHLRYGLSIILIFVYSLVSAQWVKKADGLKPRSELGETIVYNSKLYTFVGFSDTLRHAEPSSEVYDPATNTWTYLASMPANTAMTHQDVILIDNTIWHIGGRVGQNPGPLSSAIWIYNITTNSWSKGPEIRDPATGQPMVIAASGSALLGRVLHIFGGFTPTACKNDQDKYHLTLNVDTWLANPSLPAQWENKLQPLPQKRNHLSAVVLGGKIYAFGGQLGHDCGGGPDVAYCHVYNPSTDTWAALPSLPTARSHAEGSTFPLDGKIYMVGGQGNDGNSTKYVTIFDPAGNNGAGTWTTNTSLALPYIYEGLSSKVIGTNFIITHGSRGTSKYPQKATYVRTITRNLVYKLGFPAECVNLNDSTPTSLKGHTWLFTIDGSKSYTTSSNANWLTVTKNAAGTANPNAVDIEVTANASGLNPGTYNAVITATGTAGGTSYTSATLCVTLIIKAPPVNYNLQVNINGSGTVSKSPDQPTYANGSAVILTATPGTGQQFTGWSGDTSETTNPITLKMNGDKSITATFAPIPPQYSLNVSTTGNGSVLKNPSAASYDNGTSVTLTATPLAGEQFKGWYGDITSTDNPLTIIMDADKTITAAFTADVVHYKLNTTTNGNGTIAKNPDQADYASGDNVTLTAIPASGQQFTGWSGSANGSGNPLTITIDADKTITATFTPIPPLISNVTVTTGRSYTLGQLVVGTTIYTDRVYQATTVPAFLNNSPMIKTANDDKAITSTSMLSFNLSQKATVYVSYDPRGTTLPAWLSSWQKVSGQQVGVNDSKITYMLLYSKYYSAGKVTLGGNLASPAKGALNNYFVMAVQQPLLRPQNIAVANLTSNSIAVADTKNGLAKNPQGTISKFRIFPNPNKGDNVFIEAGNISKQEVITIAIQDASGRIVKSEKVIADYNGSFKKNIYMGRFLNTGVYIIKVFSASSSSQGKLVVN